VITSKPARSGTVSSTAQVADGRGDRIQKVRQKSCRQQSWVAMNDEPETGKGKNLLGHPTCDATATTKDRRKKSAVPMPVSRGFNRHGGTASPTCFFSKSFGRAAAILMTQNQETLPPSGTLPQHFPVYELVHQPSFRSNGAMADVQVLFFSTSVPLPLCPAPGQNHRLTHMGDG